MSVTHPSAVLFGCAGTEISDDERAFFADADPLGFILFARNIENPDQVRDLVFELRHSVGRVDAPVLIDQEGGRVQRLTPPHWRAAPSAARFAGLFASDRAKAEEAVRLNARLLADDLLRLGITVDCAPVLDLPQDDADPIIGDRAYGRGAAQVTALGRAACQGLLQGGVLPVLKHIPGHGRATVDSHKDLPVVDTPLADLEGHDFVPFGALNQMPWAMTAHVVYGAVDPDHPATTSKKVIEKIIRGHMAFEGALMSDDLSMQALRGDFETRARAALESGCDVVLHCNGEMDEMRAVAAGARRLEGDAWGRVARAAAMRPKAEPFDREPGLAQLQELLEDLP